MSTHRSFGAALELAGTGTTPMDVRKDLERLFVREGILPGSAHPVVVGTTGFAYRVAQCGLVTQTAANDGFHLWGNDGNVDISVSDTGAVLTAPAGGLSRIDVIYARHPSRGDNSDTTSAPVLAVAKGVANAIPTPPAIPTGATELARNTMTSAATSTLSTGNTITQSTVYTVPVGSPVPVRSDAERDALAALLTPTDEYPLEVLHVGAGNAKKGRREITYDGVAWTRWVSFSPSWAGVAGGAGAVNTGLVLVQDDLATVLTSLTFGTGGTVGGVATLTLPVATSAAAGANLGTAFLYDSSTLMTNVAAVVSTSSTAATLRAHGVVGTVTTGVPWAWTINDAIRLNLSYPI